MWEHVRDAFLQSFEHAAVETARILPGLLALVLLVVLAIVLAIAVRTAVARVLARIGLDRRVRRWATASGEDWPHEASPTALAVRVSFWAVLLTGGFVALHAFEPTTVVGARALAYMPQVIVALFLLGAGIAAARYLQLAVVVGAVNLGLHGARLLGVAVKWLVLIAAVALAFEHLGIGGRVLPIGFGVLFGGVALSAALAVGLGSRDLISRSWEQRRERPRSAPGEGVKHL